MLIKHKQKRDYGVRLCLRMFTNFQKVMFFTLFMMTNPGIGPLDLFFSSTFSAYALASAIGLWDCVFICFGYEHDHVFYLKALFAALFQPELININSTLTSSNCSALNVTFHTTIPLLLALICTEWSRIRDCWGNFRSVSWLHTKCVYIYRIQPIRKLGWDTPAKLACIVNKTVIDPFTLQNKN